MYTRIYINKSLIYKILKYSNIKTIKKLSKISKYFSNIINNYDKFIIYEEYLKNSIISPENHIKFYIYCVKIKEYQDLSYNSIYDTCYKYTQNNKIDDVIKLINLYSNDIKLFNKTQWKCFIDVFYYPLKIIRSKNLQDKLLFKY